MGTNPDCTLQVYAFDGQLFYKNVEMEEANILLFDAMGRLILKQPITNETGILEIKKLTNGLYFYQIRNRKSAVAGKFYY